jgi:hypothetical protein
MRIPYDNREWEVVSNISLIKKYAKLGYVTLHHQTGTKITGLYSNEKFTCCYIDSAKSFSDEGFDYKEKYFDGCFCPYLIRANARY